MEMLIMSAYQRSILKDYYGDPPMYFHATFDHIAHKKTKSGEKLPVTLLLDLYLVDSDDNRIEIKRDSPFKDENGNSLLADHVWVDFLYPWFKLPHELFYGDEIKFKAEVEEYPIARQNLLEERNKIWEQIKIQNDEIHANWQASKRQYHGQQYKAAYENMRAAIRENNNQGKIMQKQIQLVDYSLTNLSDIQIVKYSDPYVKRIKYKYSNYKRQGYKYSGLLAARSMHYIEKLQ